MIKEFEKYLDQYKSRSKYLDSVIPYFSKEEVYARKDELKELSDHEPGDILLDIIGEDLIFIRMGKLKG